MSNLTVVDTDILIDAGRAIPDALNCLLEIEKRSSLAVSVIVQMELIIGCRSKSELRTVERFLKRFQIIKVNETISDKAVGLLRQYRLSHGLLIADALIAASAVWIQGSFVTKNQRHYRFISDLHLLPYPYPFVPETTI